MDERGLLDRPRGIGLSRDPRGATTFVTGAYPFVLRYVEARGQRERAYEGRYEFDGTHIEYWDDTGFTADGDFVDANTCTMAA